ncbi:MAG: hypothetical protein QW429_06590, partial [Thermoprotei archaeon]
FGTNASMVPIFAAYPWMLYLLYLSFKETSTIKGLVYGIIPILLYYILIANTYFTILNIPLAFLLASFSLYLVIFLKANTLKNRILRLIQLLILLSLIAYPYVYGTIRVAAPAFASVITPKTIEIDLKHYFARGYEGSLIKTLTLTYTANITHYPQSNYKYLGSAPYYASPTITILATTTTLLIFSLILFKKPEKKPAFFLTMFLLFAGWFSAPYFLPQYVNLVSHIEPLWSLNIPEAVFPYPLSVCATLVVAYTSSIVFYTRKQLRRSLKIFLASLLIVSIILNVYPLVTTSGGGFSLPKTVYEISEIIGSSNTFNPRVMIAPSSLIYLWYNWSNYGDGQYVGAGFWDTIIRGDTFGYYQSYPPLVGFTTQYQANMSNPTIYANALMLLGANYVVYTNTSVQRTLTYTGLAAQIPTLTKTELETINNTLAEYSRAILLNQGGFTLYYYSNTTTCYTPQQIVFSQYIDNINNSALNTMSTTLGAQLNWDKAAVLYPKAYTLLTQTQQNTTHQDTYTLNPTPIVLGISGPSIQHFSCMLNTPSEGLIPIVVRYPYNPQANYGGVVLKGVSGTIRPILVQPANYGAATLLVFNLTDPGNYTLDFSLTPPMSILGYIYFYNEAIDTALLLCLLALLLGIKISRLPKNTQKKQH